MVSRFACYVREIVIINLEENLQVNKQTLTLTAPHFSENYIKMKINLNFYFRLFCGALSNGNEVGNLVEQQSGRYR